MSDRESGDCGTEIAVRNDIGVFQSLKWPFVKVVVMVRVGIVLYMMFTVAAGSSLCCCSGDRVLGSLFGSKHATTTGSRCCNYHAKGGKHPVPEDKKHPETPQPGEPCQCPNGGSHPITFSSVKSLFNSDSTRTAALSQEFGPGVFCAGDLLTWHPPAENLGFAFASPVQNPRDILSVLQSLRC